jgi:hypothetical protein
VGFLSAIEPDEFKEDPRQMFQALVNIRNLGNRHEEAPAAGLDQLEVPKCVPYLLTPSY